MKSSGRVIALCKQCGFEMIITESKLKRGRGKYCSKKCAMSDRIKGNSYAYKDGTGYDDRQYVKAYNLRNPGKKKVHNITYQAIITGKIKREPCIVCGETKVQAHHTDYNKPYNVQWLCRQHHRELHGLQKPKEERRAA